MIPLRVEFRLAGAWCVGDHPIHLDGLVGDCMLQRALLREPADLEGETVESLQSALPFAREGGVWMASVLAPNRLLHTERRFLTSKTPEATIADMQQSGRFSEPPLAKIETDGGPMKNSALYYTLQVVDKLVAWCIGNPDQLADLLSDVSYIGRKRHLGHGRLADDGIAIVEDAAARVLWKRRYLPPSISISAAERSQLAIPHDDAVARVRLAPPYWSKDNLQVALVV